MGATSQADCLCSPGQKKGASSSSGRIGAGSLEHCYSLEIAEQESLSEAQVFALEGSLQLSNGGCGREALELVQAEFTQLIARMLSLLESEVEVTVIQPSGCMGDATDEEKGAGHRWLLHLNSTSWVTCRILHSSRPEVIRLKQMLSFIEIGSQIHPGIGTLAGTDAPGIAKEKLACQENKAFPRGSRPTSLAECTCSLGYTSDESENCLPCAPGFYKDTVGNDKCTQCMTQAGIQMTTLETGTVWPRNCTWPAGFCRGAHSSMCESCPLGHFCSGGYHIKVCPVGSTTAGENKQAREDCLCSRGYTPVAQRSPCASRLYNAIIASFVLVINFGFVATAIFVLLIEMPHCDEEESEASATLSSQWSEGGTAGGRKVIANFLGEADNGWPSCWPGDLLPFRLFSGEDPGHRHQDRHGFCGREGVCGPGGPLNRLEESRGKFVLAAPQKRQKSWPRQLLANLFK